MRLARIASGIFIFIVALLVTSATVSYIYPAEHEGGDPNTASVCIDGETRPCGSDVGECNSGVQTCVGGEWGPCEGEVGPTDEICDGLDNDCNGVVDSIFYDDKGWAYCFSLRYQNNLVGQEPLVTINAYHERGIYRLIQTYIPMLSIANAINDPNRQTITQWCTGDQFCQSVFPLETLPYSGTHYITVKYEWLLGSNIMNDFAIPVECPFEYCPPDPLLADFVRWMRQKGYYECVVAHYVQASLDSVNNAIMQLFLEKRPADLVPPVTVNIYDIIPTDTEATFLGIGTDSTRDCQSNYYWPDYCPNPEPANYLFLERFFEQTFGMEFTFNYIRMEIDYSDWFGAPQLIDSTYYRFGSRDSLVNMIEDRAIVHFAIQSWNDLFVQDMTGGRRVATVSYEPWNTLGCVTYTHEWGHTLGFGHPFYNTNPRIFMPLDGIMTNGYGMSVPNYGVLDPLDPMERYALEPAVGYSDEATFYTDYSEGCTNTWSTFVCNDVDPAIVGASIFSATPDDTTYRLELTNYGGVIAGFVTLRAYRGGLLQEERIIPYLPAGATIWHDFTIGTTVAGPLRFILDEESEIDELSEANNQFVDAAACGDANADGRLTSSDIIYLVNYVFKGGMPPLGSGDVNHTGDVNSADIIYYVNYVFKSGAAPSCG